MNKVVYENYILNYINKECGTDYKIFEIDDIYDELAKTYILVYPHQFILTI